MHVGPMWGTCQPDVMYHVVYLGDMWEMGQWHGTDLHMCHHTPHVWFPILLQVCRHLLC